VIKSGSFGNRRVWLALMAATLLTLACGVLQSAMDAASGMADSFVEQTSLPPQAEALFEQIQQPPYGEYTCSGSNSQGPFRPLVIVNLHEDGTVTSEPIDPGFDDPGDGTWTYAPEQAQVGFSGQTLLDFGFYNALGNQLILDLKPEAPPDQAPQNSLICESTE
jgi:hypothetical protein